MKRISLLSLFALALFSLHAQNLTGIWRGYFFTKDQGTNYKFEVQIKQTKNSLSGVSYSYQSTQFYAKASLTGNKEQNKITLQEIRTIEVKNDDGSSVCIMNCKLAFSKSGKEEFLEGTYSSSFEKSDDKNKAGSNCGGGTVFLRRVPESDFYTENFLKPVEGKKKIIYDNQSPLANKQLQKDNTANNKQFAPTPKTTANTELKKQETVSKDMESKSKLDKSAFNKNTISYPSESTIGNNNLRNSLADISGSSPIENRIIPPVKNNRINEILKEIDVPDQLIHVSLYDNGEIDGDTVSVFINNQLVISKRMLTTTPIEFDVKLTSTTDIKEVTLVAENLGRIPPNTSLMIVESGGKRFEARITSTEQKNAVIRFKLMH